MIISMFAIALLAPQDAEQMRVRPSSEVAAVREFEAICVKSLNDPGAVERAVAASPRGYVVDASQADNRFRSWTSAYGTVHYLQRLPGERKVATPQCSFTSFTRAPVHWRTLNTELSGSVDRATSEQVAETRTRDNISWRWQERGGRSVMLYSVVNRKTPQQITLSIQAAD
jgi:hypothetical protein